MRFNIIFIAILFFAFNATAQVTSSTKVLEAIFYEKDKENWAKATEMFELLFDSEKVMTEIK